MTVSERNRLRAGLFLSGLLLICCVSLIPKARAETYDFDEGMEVLTEGLISKSKKFAKTERVAVFGIIESKSRKKWEISAHIEDGIVDVLVNNGYTVIERRRIDDVIKREVKTSTDVWFDEAQAAQFGKLVGADIVVTGRYVKWGRTMLRVSIRAIDVSQGRILAVNKVKILTDRIGDLLRPVEAEPKEEPEKPQPRQQPDYQGSQQKSDPPVNPPPQAVQPAPPLAPVLGYYCCDQFGYRRCQLVQPLPIGGSCFCYGQGYGYVCQ